MSLTCHRKVNKYRYLLLTRAPYCATFLVDKYKMFINLNENTSFLELGHLNETRRLEKGTVNFTVLSCQFDV